MSAKPAELNFSHEANAAAIRRARHELNDALAATRVDDDTAGDLVLIVSELVTNAVRHARGDHFEVRLAVTPEKLRLEVRDEGEGFSPRIAPSEDGCGGYGLFIVDRLADRWGVERGEDGVIWLELDRPTLSR